MLLRRTYGIISGIAAVALTGGLVSVAQAAPAAAEEPVLRVTVGSVQPQAAPAEGGAAAVPCQRGKAIYNRYQSCIMVGATVNVLRNGRPVGSAHFDITHRMTLKQKSLKWSESVKVGKARLVGNARGITVGLKVTCGSSKCKPTNKFPRGRKLGGSEISGKVNYQDKVAKLQKDNTSAKYIYTFTKPGYTPGGFDYRSVPFRCDDTFWNRALTRRTLNPGCAHHTYIPVLTTMGSLTDIAKNIRRVQAGGGHYGRIGSGKPLHREASERAIQDNRDKVCPRGQRPPRPGLSCDEYPFASSREGGHHVPADSRGTAWVPKEEQDKQGGRIQTFQKKERIVHRDAFWVKV
ncbi:NucA/NucB deoxyribonuclease domain-containing protein [Streptomyces sp. NPDC053474]|uniref:NucA/NucB deoxyribonuclease domain-containing protein n=1 Tax=Streptomyces sp. NPDC053474 TaxID=3365704 RepID=UPI0037CD6633